MNQPDWSNAPEGATHYGESSPSAYFYRIPSILGGHYDYWNTKSADPEWRSGLGDPVAPVLVERPEEWNGTGLPPVGVVCEYTSGVCEKWYGCEIIAYHDDHVWLRTTGAGRDHVKIAAAFHFRPIRTPEQIAADERESAIEDMWRVYWQPDAPTAKQALGLLWDAGYRKQSTKQDDQ